MREELVTILKRIQAWLEYFGLWTPDPVDRTQKAIQDFERRIYPRVSTGIKHWFETMTRRH